MSTSAILLTKTAKGAVFVNPGDIDEQISVTTTKVKRRIGKTTQKLARNELAVVYQVPVPQGTDPSISANENGRLIISCQPDNYLKILEDLYLNAKALAVNNPVSLQGVPVGIQMTGLTFHNIA